MSQETTYSMIYTIEIVALVIRVKSNPGIMGGTNYNSEN